MTTLPEDVHADSRCRLPLPARESLDAEGRALYDQLCAPATSSLVGIQGPAGIRLHSPRVAHLTHALVSHLRNHSALDPRLREIAILATAREHDSRFEWAAHEPEALRVGVDPAVIDVIRNDTAVDAVNDGPQVVIRLARQLFRERQVGPALFAAALEQFGARTLVDLVSVMCHYSGTASLLAAFDMQLPSGCTPDLPPRR